MTQQNAVPNRLIRRNPPIFSSMPTIPHCILAKKLRQGSSLIGYLYIGYSSCHWCHVMARESFEDEEVAAILNKHFISIKVDREERPDIDHIYMEVCQAMTAGVAGR